MTAALQHDAQRTPIPLRPGAAAQLAPTPCHAIASREDGSTLSSVKERGSHGAFTSPRDVDEVFTSSTTYHAVASA